MLKRSLKVLIAVVLSLMFTVSLVKIVLLIWSSHPAAPHSAPPLPTVDEWLESENLASYKQLFRDKGESVTDMLNAKSIIKGHIALWLI